MSQSLTAEFPLTIQPAGAAWRALLRRNSTPDARRFREQLGLPADRPVIMTGHHTLFWHPGILAKYIAADGAARACGGAPAWLVTDQDREETFKSVYPVRRANGRLGENWIEYVGRPRPAGAEVLIRDRPQPGDQAALPSIPEGLARIAAALRAHGSAAPYARWQTAALVDLAAPFRLFPGAPPVVMATDLCRTDLFARLVERMGQDPEGCIWAYNAAVARHPLAGMRPLTADPVQDRWELPLWWLPPEGPRRHVYAEDLRAIPLEQLAPKALFMTGLVRLSGCDLFIHGVGGGGALNEAAGQEGYDVITEDWMRAWLGADLAPMTVVTATMLLPLMPGPPPSTEQIARAAWLAHHARHNPDVLRDAYAADAKARLVAALRAAPREERRILFHRMHRLLDGYTAAHAQDLEALDRNAAEARGLAADAVIASDRTWGFPLHPPERIAALRDRIAAEFADR